MLTLVINNRMRHNNGYYPDALEKIALKSVLETRYTNNVNQDGINCNKAMLSATAVSNEHDQP